MHSHRRDRRHHHHIPWSLVALVSVPLVVGCGNVNTNNVPQASGAGPFQDGTGVGASSGGQDSGGGAGAGQDACTPAQRKCASLGEAATCGATGRWTVTKCGEGKICDDGLCAAIVCKPNDTLCDGNKITRCNSRGTILEVVDACVGTQICIAGGCSDKTCQPGATKCVGNSVLTCGADMSWSKQSCAADETCATKLGDSKASCLAHACAPGTDTCLGAKAAHCSADGLTQQITDDCSVPGKDGGLRVCLGGKCAAKTCKAGDKTCADGGLQICKPDSSGWEKVTCGGDEACGEDKDDPSNTGCKKVMCKPNEVYCDGLKVTRCDPSGTIAKVVQSCNGDLQQCKSGGCVDLAIVCGDGFCDEGESNENCAKDCTQMVTLAPDFDALGKNVTTDLPRAPRALTKPMPHASYTSGTLALGGNWLYLVDRDNGALVLMDRKTLAVGHVLKLGAQPEHVVIGPDGTAWISVKDEDAVVKLPPGATSMKDAVKWQVGASPIGMALTPDGKLLLIALSGEAAVIGVDPGTGKELARAKGKLMPRTVAIGSQGKAAVLHGTGEVGAIDVKKMGQGNALQPVLVSETFANLRVANASQVCRGILFVNKRVPNRALGAAIQPESGMMLVGHVLANLGDANDVLSSAGVKPKKKALKPIVTVIKVCSSSGYGSTCKNVTKHTMPNPPPPCVGSPVRPYEASISFLQPDMSVVKKAAKMAPVIDKLNNRNFLTRFDQPAGMVHHPTMSMAFMTAKGTNNVLVVNTAAPDPMMWPIADIKVGMGPKSIVISPDGKKAWVHNSTAFTVSEIDLAPLLKFNDPLTNGKAMPKIEPLFMQQVKEVAYAKDPLGQVGNLGRQIFHNAMNARLNAANRFACATCHLDGMEDKSVWFVSEGPRQTPALAGRLHDTAPFNWMGTKFTLHDNMKNTTTRMGGTGLKKFELEALGTFIKTGLKPPRNPNISKGGLTPQQLAGKKLFNDPKVACANCHSGAALTDGAQHDVGTATELELKVQKIFAGNDKPKKVVFNTPTLRGLWYTAPYLHDGSAKTLKEALKKTAKTMGRTDHLTEKQLDALVAYLRTL